MNAMNDAAVVLKAERKAAFEANKLSKRLHRQVGQAIADFNMIEDGDKVMVCLSGGKDSFALLDILLFLREHAPVAFDIVAVNLDQKQPGFPAHVLPAYLESIGVPFHIENQDTYSIVKRLIPEGQTMCSLCSRLRRGILYRVARELGCNVLRYGPQLHTTLRADGVQLIIGPQSSAELAAIRSYVDASEVIIVLWSILSVPHFVTVRPRSPNMTGRSSGSKSIRSSTSRPPATTCASTPATIR